MPLLRYEIRDMVRRLAGEDLTCELAGMPATSSILGKAGHLSTPPDRPVPVRADLRELTFTSAAWEPS